MTRWSEICPLAVLKGFRLKSKGNHSATVRVGQVAMARSSSDKKPEWNYTAVASAPLNSHRKGDVPDINGPYVCTIWTRTLHSRSGLSVTARDWLWVTWETQVDPWKNDCIPTVYRLQWPNYCVSVVHFFYLLNDISYHIYSEKNVLPIAL